MCSYDIPLFCINQGSVFLTIYVSDQDTNAIEEVDTIQYQYSSTNAFRGLVRDEDYDSYNLIGQRNVLPSR